MASEPPIELQDRRRLRISTDSLQRDIFDAIRTAHTLHVPERGTMHRPLSNASTLHSATSANSMLTGNSYVDFDTSAKNIPGAKAKLYKERIEKMHRQVVSKSVSFSSRALGPLGALGRPFSAARAYWRRRRMLPPTESGRKVPIDFADPKGAVQLDERNKKPYCSNLITSSIYTVYDFVPRQLVVQFSKLANMYFLFVAILQMIPSWSATGNYTTIVPLCVFVFISMAREGYEDWTRHRNDKEENNREVLVAHKNEETGLIDYETKKWKNVKVGDVVRVLQNEWIPADIVLLHSSGARGQCSIETLALDGETTLKSREVPSDVQKHFNVENIEQARAVVTSEDPNLDLFNFEGTIELFDNDTGKVNLVPLENSNIIYRGSALRNTASVIGVCVFTGKETKMQLNASRNARTKTPKLQGKVNRIVIMLACYVLLLSGFFTLAAERIQGSRPYWYLDGIHVTRTQNMMGFIIMFNTLIPLSLYVSMEICKVFQQFLMQNDIDMYDEINDVRCNVQTASLNEELGQVSYVFSDKTGTLTDNIMLFRKMSVAGHAWIHDLDLYFDQDEDGYLFHKARPMDVDQLNDNEAILLEQLARLPRRSFGGRISNAARISMGRPSMNRPSLGRLSLSRPSMGRPSLSRPSLSRPSLSRPSLSRPSLSRPSLSRPSLSRPSLSRPSLGGLGRPSLGRASVGTAEITEASVEDGSPQPKRTTTKKGDHDDTRPRKSVVLTRPVSEDSDDDVNPSNYAGPSSSAYNGNGPRPSGPRPSGPGPSGPRPSGPRPSGMTGRTTQWLSSSAPLKPQSTPSTLTLLEYLMTHPHSAFSERAKFFLLAIALCHSASPEVDLTGSGEAGKDEIEQLDYQAASPDELALVAAARDLGYLVIDRQHDSMTIRTYPKGFDNPPQDDVYQVLDTIEFTSGRKRMSVVVKFPDGRYVVFCKGADNVIIERLRKSLLGVAHTKKTDIYHETQVRRSVEADLAMETMHYDASRPSIDDLLRRRNIDLSIEESGRRSMQLRRQSMENNGPPTNVPQKRASLIQTAIADASAAAAENVTRTSFSLDMNNAAARSQTSLVGTQQGSSSQQSQQPQPQQHRNLNTSEKYHRSSHNLTNNGGSGGNGNNNNSNNVSFAESSPQQHSRVDDLDIEDLSERQILEKTLEQIDEFSTEGLRTLLYGHKFITRSEYELWKKEYDAARSAISNRQAKLDEVGERLETEFHITGATAIEDKLQKGVPEAIDKLRRANIRMWMLTGDKRETAVNIGYSCRLIKDFSTVISLKADDDIEAKIMAALDELDNNNIAHCVVVVDGQTLAGIEKDPVLLSLFVDLGLRVDSAIVCRASPAQKANIVKCVRQREPSKVMLAIGDGANDIAMIQSADVGIGIAGREGLQAARSSDFSIGQFRFLLKLLFVHGRWNYVRTCKYILSTFYKEFLFYMSQAIYQRNTMFTGTSVFESWSIAMFNTLFTSLPVLCVGIFDQDLSPTTLIAIPELYRIGPENREFRLTLFFEWIIIAMAECVMVNFLSFEFYGKQYGVSDNSIYPLGVTIYAGIVGMVCFKIQFVSMMHYITLISLIVVVVSFGGYLLFNILIGLVYIIDPAKTYYVAREFWNELGQEIAFWAIILLVVGIVFVFELMLKIISNKFFPTDTDVFQELEKDPHIIQRLESESELELHQGWEYQDKLDHSWTAIFRNKWPAQPRPTVAEPVTTKRRKMEVLAEKLRLRKPVDYEQEIQEILERRQQETEQIRYMP